MSTGTSTCPTSPAWGTPSIGTTSVTTQSRSRARNSRQLGQVCHGRRGNSTTSAGSRDQRVCGLFDSRECRAGVLAAKSEAVCQGRLDFHLAERVGNVVKIALWIGIVQIDRWRHHAIPNGKDAGQRRNRPSSAQQVAEHRLVGGDGDVVGVIAEWVLDRLGLGDISDGGAGAVSYTHLRAHETVLDLVCRLLLE